MTQDKGERVFAREERYIVIKRKHLVEDEEQQLRECLYDLNVTPVECVVVESDWPEYETVWRMIEDRVTTHIANTEPSTPAGEVTRDAIDAGLRAFCASTPDFDMSAAMRRSAVDFIVAEPGLYASRTTETETVTALRAVADAAAKVDEFIHTTPDCQRPDVWWMRVDELRRALAALNAEKANG